MNKAAQIYRMIGPDSICPSRLKAKDILEQNGFAVADTPLSTRAEIDTFKEQHNVATTPQVFIDGQRIGGLQDLQNHLRLNEDAATSKSYTPVIALFSVAPLMALAVTWLALGQIFTGQSIAWFISIAMILLGLQKLGNLQKFSDLFRTYDLLAQRVPAYGLVYPFINRGGAFDAGGRFDMAFSPHNLDRCQYWGS